MEHNPERSFGYISVFFLKTKILITYYDWPLEIGEAKAGIFNLVEVRQRLLPRQALEQVFC